MRKRRYAGGGGTGYYKSPVALPGGSGEEPATGRQYSPLADLLHYGEGPEHQFFTGRLPPTAGISGYDDSAPKIPIAGGNSGASNLAGAIGAAAKIGKAYKDLTGKAPAKGGSSQYDFTVPDIDYEFPSGGLGSYGAGLGDYSSTLGGGAASNADALANLDSISAGDMFGTSSSAAAGAGPGSLGGQALDSGIAGGSNLGAAGATTGWNGITQGSLANGLGMNDATGILGGLYSLTQKEGKFAGTASGAMSGMQLAGWPGAIVGAALGYAQEGGIDDANPWDASGFSGLGMDAAWKDQNIARLASNPAASVASKLGLKDDSLGMKLLDPGSFFSKHGDEKRNIKAFMNENDIYDAGGGKYKVGNATLTKDQLQDLAGAWYGATYHPDGKEDYWKALYGQKVQQYGLARGGTPHLTPLGLDLSNEARYMHGGPGSGRGDEIDAKLSPKEYVMDAETVALLGDGNPDHGAKLLDNMRRKIRAHKGKALAKGKFSPNAKAPEEYL